MQIWWGWRLAFDASLLYTFMNYFALYPTIFWRHSKMEPVRWTQRRRAYFNNPYFSAPSLWKNSYDKNFHVIEKQL
jgi:hypothetical protein